MFDFSGPTAAVVVTSIISLVSMVMKYVPAKAKEEPSSMHSFRNILQQAVTDVAILKERDMSRDRMIIDLKSELKAEIHAMRADLQTALHYMKGEGNK